MGYVMPDFLAVAGYGGYVSPIKFAVFLILYFGWLYIIDWVHKDAEVVAGDLQTAEKTLKKKVVTSTC